MSKRYKNSNYNMKNIVIIIAIVVAISLIAKYPYFFLSIIGLIAIFYLVKLIIKINRKRALKLAYYSSHYYKETNKPYSSDILDRGTRYEIEIFNKIRDFVGDKYQLLSDLSISQMDAINIDSQIDLMLFHDTGIYVIEVKNFSGPLSGRLDDDLWVPYLLVPRKEKKKSIEYEYIVNDNLYNKWKKEKYKSNPIKQNNVHINSLSKIYDAKYVNIVIFSEDMVNQNSNNQKTISNIYTISEFLEFLNTQDKIYTEDELNLIFENIMKYNRGNSKEVKSMHVSRLNSNK